jgi:hypothetical protein
LAGPKGHRALMDGFGDNGRVLAVGQVYLTSTALKWKHPSRAKVSRKRGQGALRARLQVGRLTFVSLDLDAISRCPHSDLWRLLGGRLTTRHTRPDFVRRRLMRMQRAWGGVALRCRRLGQLTDLPRGANSGPSPRVLAPATGPRTGTRQRGPRLALAGDTPVASGAPVRRALRSVRSGRRSAKPNKPNAPNTPNAPDESNTWDAPAQRSAGGSRRANRVAVPQRACIRRPRESIGARSDVSWP